MFQADPEWQEAERMGYPDASESTAIASAKQGAGVKGEGKVRDHRGIDLDLSSSSAETGERGSQ